MPILNFVVDVGYILVYIGHMLSLNNIDMAAGTADLTISGKTQTVTIKPMYEFDDATAAYTSNVRFIRILGIAGRFRTGQRVWNCTATYFPKTGNISNIQCSMDMRTSRTISVVGFYSDFDKTVSNHPGERLPKEVA